MTDAEALQAITSAVDQWRAEHPTASPLGRIPVAGDIAEKDLAGWAVIRAAVYQLVHGSPVASHPLKNTIGIDCVGDWKLNWGGGLDKLLSVRVDGVRALGMFFLDPMTQRPDGSLIWDDATARYLTSHGRKVGVRYVPHSWDAGLAPELAARKCFDYVQWYRTRSVTISCVEHDIENVVWKGVQHSMAWQLAYLLGTPGTKGVAGANGQYPDPSRPDTLGWLWNTPGVWTMEGRQSTNSSAALQAAACGMLIGPQCYPGGSNDMVDGWSVWADATYWGQRCGFDHFIPYLDARRPRWNGDRQRVEGSRMAGEFETVLYDTTRLTELYQ